jgi:hypothetical protein
MMAWWRGDGFDADGQLIGRASSGLLNKAALTCYFLLLVCFGCFLLE